MQIILNTYGTMLNRDNEAFVVTNDQGRRRVPTDGVTSIMLTRGTSITADAVMLAIDHEIEIHFADRRGNIQGMVWSHKYGSVSTIRRASWSSAAAGRRCSGSRTAETRQKNLQNPRIFAKNALIPQTREI